MTCPEGEMRRAGRAIAGRAGGFTLTELMFAVVIIALLAGLFVPALGQARQAARRLKCLSNLRGIGLGILFYADENDNRLPYVDSALWGPGGQLDWDADPLDRAAYPYSFPNVMDRYLGGQAATVCPAAVRGCPQRRPVMTYRVASADNFDGNAHLAAVRQGRPTYAYSLKYLDGRFYEVRHIDATRLPLRLVDGPGPYYLLRDFIDFADANGNGTRDAGEPLRLPHGDGYNQLFVDLHVETIAVDRRTGLTASGAGVSFP